jgi:hypothetical protein
MMMRKIVKGIERKERGSFIEDSFKNQCCQSGLGAVSATAIIEGWDIHET